MSRFLVASAFALLIFPSCGDTATADDECQRSLDRFEETRRMETLEAREELIKIERRAGELSKVELKEALAIVRSHMDAAVEQVGCE